MTRGDWAGFAFVAAIVVAGIVLLVDWAGGTWQPPQSAVVASRAHHPAWTQIVTTFSTDGKGHMTPHVTIVNHPERWELVCETEETAISLNVSATYWRSVGEGSELSVQCLKGWLTGANRGWRITPEAPATSNP